ncbi:carbohydrate kinase [Rubripirellula sp.]|nr:carbohydrate kinase [Planctomycetaceae bacterium]MDA9857651.1 carbohydrate kinase [Rubripirellula sp.]MDF1843179.1 carbohydrate kinase [Rubripirellula sp.]
MPYQIAGIGEILWDVFPDGPRFGGAPANFACSAASLAGTQANVSMISAVGDDRLGQQAIDALQQRKVKTAMVQISRHPTGRVLVELDKAGVASYRFDEDSAWDHLNWIDDLTTFAGTCDAVCFGTLGQRSKTSLKTINRLLEEVPESALRILDVNLRAPFFDDDLILASLSMANVLKLNSDELPYVARLHSFTGSDLDIMQRLASTYQLRCVALTRGAEGAVIAAGDAVSELPGMVVNVVDTVGAGDAFTASLMLDLLTEQSVDTINQRAIATASYACSMPGATMPFPQHLRRP